jgi:hypothetical protein
MTTEDWLALGAAAGSLVSWGLAQARNIGRVEGRLDRSAGDQGRRIGGLEDRVTALETIVASLKKPG